MISTELLIEKANFLIASGNLTELQVAQLSAIQKFTDNSKYIVPNISSLPDAAANEGRLVYVVSEEDFYFSRGFDWTTVFDSTIGVIKQDVYAWGRNSYGQIGNNAGGTFSDRVSSPTLIAGGISNWSSISCGGDQNLALRSDGTIYSWGTNGFGQLATNDVSRRSSPVLIVGGITNFASILAGSDFNPPMFGLTSDGVIYSWGANNGGRLGDGDGGINRSSPVTVIGGLTWAKLSKNTFSITHAITTTGELYGWGPGSAGQIGDGTGIGRSSPVSVLGGITNWKDIVSTGTSTAGITNDGNIYTWGFALNGRLGTNTAGFVSFTSPISILGGITGWQDVACGGSHVVAIANGAAYAWGCNVSGQLGDGTTIERSSPVSVVGGITNFTQVVAGNSHNMGLTSNGVLYAWGDNGLGNLGTLNTTTVSSPVTVVGGITNWAKISAGGSNSMGMEVIEKGFNEP